MEVKILEKQDNRIRLFVEGIELSIVNSIRRTMIADVPSMAIEDVIVIENSSPMKGDILAHRLGLIPLKTDLESYILREKCDCGNDLGCGKCNVILTLEADAAGLTRTVYSKDLKSSDPDIVPACGEFPITKLTRDQRLRIEAYARLGRGSEHAKWQPVSVCTVRPVSKIIIDQNKCDSCEICVGACHKQILRIGNGNVEIVDSENCNACRQCQEACPKDAIKIENRGKAFIFNIESTGALPPERIFDSAIEILKEKSQELIDQISNLI